MEIFWARVAAASPRVTVAAVDKNVDELVKMACNVYAQGAQWLVFPELCLTGYTCGDLFLQEELLQAAWQGLLKYVQASTEFPNMVTALGLPVQYYGPVYNCAAVCQNGKLLGLVPKQYLPNYGEFYEKRWFSSGKDFRGKYINYEDEQIPFGIDLVFQSDRHRDWMVGIELCEDLWAPLPPSAQLGLAGALMIANLSASNEVVGKDAYRRQLVAQQSGRCLCAYVYASAGVHESTTDTVFSGQCLIAENGAITSENEPFQRGNQWIIKDVVLEDMLYDRRRLTTWRDALIDVRMPCRYIPFHSESLRAPFKHRVDPHPFVPGSDKDREQRCHDIFSMQATALAKRLEHIQVQHALLGISGGLDSTLSLLVTVRAFELLKWPLKRIIGVTMPGYGTSDRTLQNSLKLMKALKITRLEIPITAACDQHFQDIGHPVDQHDTVFENAQARERTQILMDLANQRNGLVVGTGDLSELALGWCTYSGDQISMYNVNCGVPKTLVRYLVDWVALHHASRAARMALEDILDTPISPELLPLNEAGEISQSTEAIIGPYELHDFFLYYMLRYGRRPYKIAWLANQAFAGKYERIEILNWLRVFYERFFRHQFKRTCMPDGPKIGSVSLSPRGDWRMPSDADGDEWLRQVDEMISA